MFSLIDDWANHIIDTMNAESKLVGEMLQHHGLKGDARETIVRTILDRIIPAQYEIGTGEIVDHMGKKSRQIDIVISRRDFPTLKLPNGARIYPIESVLAGIEVKTELNADKLHEALDNIASIAQLSSRISNNSPETIVKEFKLKEKADSVGIYYSDSLNIGRCRQSIFPTTYIFSFKGYSNNITDFKNAIMSWAEANKNALNFVMLPSVIAAKSCFAIKNCKPYLFNNDYFMGLGLDENPIRLLITHILYSVLDKIPSSSSSYKVSPDVGVYIEQTSVPKVNDWVFVSKKSTDEITLHKNQ